MTWLKKVYPSTLHNLYHTNKPMKYNKMNKRKEVGRQQQIINKDIGSVKEIVIVEIANVNVSMIVEKSIVWNVLVII